MENLSEKFLKLPLNTRRDILIQVLKTMDDKVFEELCFRLTAPEELLSVWDQKVEPTKEILKIMSKIFFIMRSGSLTREFAEKFGDHYISDETKKATD